MRHISTTITKAFFEMKMQDLERDGRFYEYKSNTPYWYKRLTNLVSGNWELIEPTEIVFLVGKTPYRFKVEAIKFDPDEVPARYASALKTESVYAIKCVPLEGTA